MALARERAMAKRIFVRQLLDPPDWTHGVLLWLAGLILQPGRGTRR
jgi:hypothetical protein